MSRVPGWLGRVGAGLTKMGQRLDERRAETDRESGAVPESLVPETPVAPAVELPPPAPR
ncbi:AI-2E family transporter, partial [Streptomyces bobili]